MCLDALRSPGGEDGTRARGDGSGMYEACQSNRQENKEEVIVEDIFGSNC